MSHKKKILGVNAWIVVIILSALAYGMYTGVLDLSGLQKASYAQGNTYYATPVFASLKCEDTRQPTCAADGSGCPRENVNIEHRALGDILSGWIDCTESTLTCDVSIRLHTYRALGDATAPIKYRICTNNRATCTDLITLTHTIKGGEFSEVVDITEIQRGQSLKIESIDTGFGTQNFADTFIYRRSTIWALKSYDVIGGGITTYNPAGCHFAGGLFNPDLLPSSAPADMYPGSPEFNFVRLWIPILNIEGLPYSPKTTYNGQEAICLGRNIYNVDTFNSRAGQIKYPKTVIAQVTCCNGDETPSQICENFQWKARSETELQCISDTECQPDWAIDASQQTYTAFKGACAENVCEYQTKQITCNPGEPSSCASGQFCIFNPNTGDASCKSAADIERPGPGGTASDINWIFWIIVIAIIIILITVIWKIV